MALSIKQFLEDLLDTTLDGHGNPNASAKCVCHDDSANSMSVHTGNGLWTCHAMGTGGNIMTLVAKKKGISNSEARKILDKAGITMDQISAGTKQKRDEEASEKDAPEVPKKVVDTYIKSLINDPARLERAKQDFGWSQKQIDKAGIGWNLSTKRYTFPIYDKEGRCVNIRLYDPDSEGAQKTTSWTTGKGQAGFGMSRLYPVEWPTENNVILVEGEKDCTLVNQIIEEQAIPDTIAITTTTGVGTWKAYWNKRFEGKNIIIAYDRDDAGVTSASEAASQLQEAATHIKIVILDSDVKGYDVTDFFVKDGKSWNDFLALIDLAEYWTPQTKRVKMQKVKDANIYTPHLSEASQEKYLHKNLELTVMVAGKESAPFAVPRKRVYDCNIDYGQACKNCALSRNNGLLNVEYDTDDPTLIKYIRVTDKAQETMIREDNGINTRCPKVKPETLAETNIEELTIVPEIDFAEEDLPYETRTLYTTMHGVIPNKTYTIRGTTIAHPKTQHVVHFAYEMEPAQDSIDNFVMTPEKLEMLKIFQPKENQTVGDKFEEIAQDLAANVTGIIGRNDIIKAVDLCYHTVIAFDFDGSPVAKAWGDILVFGDTRTGKSETVTEIQRHYRLGELSVAENTTFAGLVGGLKQEAEGRWNIMWGRIPLNNRRLLAIDEASGLDIDIIGAMSGIRSDGIASLVKIVTQKTMARTRLIWMSNPRSEKAVAEYAYGVEAVRELMGRPEDVARFDLVVCAAAREVDPKIINQLKSSRADILHTYTSDLSHELVLWAWSRKSANIMFTPEATIAVLEAATEQSSRYSSNGIALIDAGNHRLKLAKLAVSAAIRTFSTVNGEDVIVTPAHVKFIVDFLDEIYRKPSLDYIGWSENKLIRDNVPQAAIDEVRDWVRTHGDWAATWLYNKTCRPDDFRTQFDLTMEDTKRMIFKPLSRLYMIDRNKSGFFSATEPFLREIKFIKQTEGLTPTVMGLGSSTSGSSQGNLSGGGNDLIDDSSIPF